MAKARNVEKATAISNAHIQFVSLVDAAANKRKFLLTKEKDGKAAFSIYGRIVKKDSENHYVTGIVYEPLTEDAHGDYMEAEEIQKAAYWFAKNSGAIDIQHSFEPFDGATVVENWIAKADFKMGDEEIKAGSWLITVEITDADVWSQIEKGEITGFSMGGVGEYSEEDVELNELEKSEKRGLLNKLAEALGISGTNSTNDTPTADARSVTKAGKKMSCKNRETLNGIYESLGAFLKEFDDPEEDEEQKKASNGELNDGDPEPDEDKEDKEVTKQEIEKIVADAIAKAMQNTAQTAQNGAETVEKSERENITSQEITPENIEKMIQTAVEKALMPQREEPVTAERIEDMINKAVAKAVEPVLKSKGLPSNLNGNNVEKSAGEDHYLHGIL